jgi:hypothetical protein
MYPNVNSVVTPLSVCHTFECNGISTLDKFSMGLSENVANSILYRKGFFAF